MVATVWVRLCAACLIHRILTSELSLPRRVDDGLMACSGDLCGSGPLPQIACMTRVLTVADNQGFGIPPFPHGVLSCLASGKKNRDAAMRLAVSLLVCLLLGHERSTLPCLGDCTKLKRPGSHRICNPLSQKLTSLFP